MPIATGTIEKFLADHPRRPPSTLNGVRIPETTGLLAAIRAELIRQGHTPTTLSNAARIDYRSAWTLMRGDSKRIAWRTLDAVLAALGMSWPEREDTP